MDVGRPLSNLLGPGRVLGALRIPAAIGTFALLPGGAVLVPWQGRTGRAIVLRIARGTSTRG